MKARTRIAASVVLAVSVALGTAGCNLVAPQATLMKYEPSDGVNGTTGKIDIRNAMLITKDGQKASLVVSLVNTDSEKHTLTVQYENASGAKQNLTIPVPPDTVQATFDDTDPVTLTGLDVAPGSLYPLYFQYGDEPGTQLQVPVLTGDLDDYSDYLPSNTP